jgi:hypothetical protein
MTLVFEPAAAIPDDTAGAVLLTGGTGFVGPFPLKSLLEQTDERIYAVRAGMSHMPASGSGGTVAVARPATRAAVEDFHRRDAGWWGSGSGPPTGRRVAHLPHVSTTPSTQNAAAVNYLFNGETLRTSNARHELILGWRWICRLKVFNYMSTIFHFR